MDIKINNRFIHIQFDRPKKFLSWAIVGGGESTGQDIYWAKVHEKELPIHLDPIEVLKRRMVNDGINGIGLMTSARIEDPSLSSFEKGGISVKCLSTVGMGNALRVGDPARSYPRVGTINIVLSVNCALNMNAKLEALSIISEARTLAVLENKIQSTKSEKLSTGTGTDCMILACEAEGVEQTYSGKHTIIGELIGKAVYNSVDCGIKKWIQSKNEQDYSNRRWS